MATKKITLNELRSIVKQIIREETEIKRKYYVCTYDWMGQRTGNVEPIELYPSEVAEYEKKTGHEVYDKYSEAVWAAQS